MLAPLRFDARRLARDVARRLVVRAPRRFGRGGERGVALAVAAPALDRVERAPGRSPRARPTGAPPRTGSRPDSHSLSGSAAPSALRAATRRAEARLVAPSVPRPRRRPRPGPRVWAVARLVARPFGLDLAPPRIGQAPGPPPRSRRRRPVRRVSPRRDRLARRVRRAAGRPRARPSAPAASLAGAAATGSATAPRPPAVSTHHDSRGGRPAPRRRYAGVDQRAPGHLGGLRQPHQREQRRRDVLQRAAGRERRRAADVDERHDVERVRGVRLAGRGSCIISALPWSAVMRTSPPARARRVDDAAEARVERLDRLDGGVEVAGVADHVAVREVADDRVVAARSRSPRRACR